MDHPDGGTVRQLRNPVRYSETPTNVRRIPPALGEHTDDVLQELGYSDEQIQTLRTNSVVS